MLRFYVRILRKLVKLLKQEMYDFVGTDLHHLARYQPLLDKLKLTRKQLDALGELIANNARI